MAPFTLSQEIKMMDPRAIDIRGKWFGMLYALRPVGSSGGRGTVWYCLCRCGGNKKVIAGLLRSGHIKSCGCMARESRRESIKKARLVRLGQTTDERRMVDTKSDRILEHLEIESAVSDQSNRSTSFVPSLNRYTR